MAPFTLEELVSAANSILRDKPRMEVSARTVRYYISRGLLPGAIGSPKNARYRMEHLEKLVAIRLRLDEGQSLDQISEELESEEGPEWASAPLMERRHEVKPRSLQLHQTREDYDVPSPTLMRVVRLQMTKDVTLEVAERADRQSALRELFERLKMMFHDT